MKTFLQNNNIKIYATHNEEKSVVAERFIRTFMNKIYNYMISISKNVYIDKLDEIVNKYNNTYHTITKIKPVDVCILTLIRKIIRKILHLKLAIVEEYQNIRTFLQKTMFQIGLRKFLRLKKLKILFLGHMLLVT